MALGVTQKANGRFAVVPGEGHEFLEDPAFFLTAARRHLGRQLSTSSHIFTGNLDFEEPMPSSVTLSMRQCNPLV